MPDFSEPKYASYVQLCRELRLKRPGQAGDWSLIDKHPGALWWSEQFSDEGEAIWLPTLADWLEMLEAAGCADVAFFHEDPDWSCQKAPYDVNEDWRRYPASGNRPTREEAAARLWLAVTRPT